MKTSTKNVIRKSTINVLKRNRNKYATGTEAAVCADIAARQALGIAKYGTTVAQNPLELRSWMQNAFEEALDLSIYLKRAIEEIDKQKMAEVQG